MFDIEPHDDNFHAFKTVVLNVLHGEWLLQLYLIHYCFSGIQLGVNKLIYY